MFARLGRGRLAKVKEKNEQKQSSGGVVKKVFLKISQNYLCQSLFFNKVAGLRPVFCEFCDFFKNASGGCF